MSNEQRVIRPGVRKKAGPNPVRVQSKRQGLPIRTPAPDNAVKKQP